MAIERTEKGKNSFRLEPLSDIKYEAHLLRLLKTTENKKSLLPVKKKEMISQINKMLKECQDRLQEQQKEKKTF